MADQAGPPAAQSPSGPAAPAPPVPVAATPVRDGIGLGLAVGLSGLAYGAAAVSSGLSVGQACALSLLAFTGASQFALAGTIAAGGSLVAGVASAVLLGSRSTLYALRLAGTLAVRGPVRLLAAMGVIDETTAMATAQPDRASSRTAFWATFGTLYLTWNLATLAGALGAGRFGSPQDLGLDVVGPAAFLALIWPRLRGGRAEQVAGAGGALIALATAPFLPSGVPIILAAPAAFAVALAIRGRPSAGAAADGAAGTAAADGTAR
jgi:predicted branched-subunit amino acid permease